MAKNSMHLAHVELKNGNGERFTVTLSVDLGKLDKVAASLGNKAGRANRSYASACYGLIQADVRRIETQGTKE